MTWNSFLIPAPKQVRYDYPIPLGKLNESFWAITDRWQMSVQLPDNLWLNLDVFPRVRTDLGSVPSRLQGIVNNGSGDPTLLAFFLLHDIGYRKQVFSKEFIDWILVSGMRIPNLASVDDWDFALTYFGVHFLGTDSWNNAPRIHAGMLDLCRLSIDPKPLYGLPQIFP